MSTCRERYRSTQPDFDFIVPLSSSFGLMIGLVETFTLLLSTICLDLTVSYISHHVFPRVYSHRLSFYFDVSKCQTLIIIENMQSNASSSKTPRRSIVRSLLQRITKKKDTKDSYPTFLDVSAETENCQLEDDFFKFDANDDLSSADK
ncbi:hypothetical protein EV424DRAFT_1541867 [Suillus variegatus]|nr:hypothetical protein EV424DRAFT_1541867 [Suillus variegatus]